MSLKFEHGDITKMHVDAIVNTTNTRLYMGRGVDTALRTAAGTGIEEELDAIGECMPGEAVVTKGYDLPAKYVIHTVGPHWHGGYSGEAAILRSCYRSCLEKADELGLKTIAFPFLCTGNYDYPKALAIKEAVTTITDYLEKTDLEVTLLLFDAESKKAQEEFSAKWTNHLKAKSNTIIAKPTTLEGILKEKVTTFADALVEAVDASGMTDAQVYKRALVTKGAYNKILNGVTKKPSVSTAVALAMALHMTMPETEAFLSKAGLALGDTVFDRIIRFQIENGNYDIDKTNELLFDNGQSLIGCI